MMGTWGPVYGAGFEHQEDFDSRLGVFCTGSPVDSDPDGPGRDCEGLPPLGSSAGSVNESSVGADWFKVKATFRSGIEAANSFPMEKHGNDQTC